MDKIILKEVFVVVSNRTVESNVIIDGKYFKVAPILLGFATF